MGRALATLTFGFALCLAGATFDSASLYVPGVALVLLAVVAVVWVRLAALGARLERAPGPPSIMEEEPYPLRLELGAGLLPAPGGELLEPLLGWPVPIAGRRSQRIRINVRFSRRGRRALEPALLVVRDPLGLDRVEVSGSGGEELLVLPRVERLQAAGKGGGAGSGLDGQGGDDSGSIGRRLEAASAELEIDGLRPYREGSPASRIHWPVVARSGEMVERRLVADLDSAPLVVMDGSNPASDDALDSAVRAAASLCVHLARQGGCALLLPGDRRPVAIGHDLAGWPPLHARLALLAPGPPPSTIARAPRAGGVFWVTASAASPRALERLPAASRWLVSPGVAEGSAAFTVAGCSGRRVGRSRSVAA